MRVHDSIVRDVRLRDATFSVLFWMGEIKSCQVNRCGRWWICLVDQWPANLQTSTPVSEETKLWDFRSFMILLMHNVSISSHLKSLKKVSECDREHRCNHGNPLSLICLQPHTAESCWLLTVCSLSVSSFDAVISHESVLDVWCETMWNVLIGRVSRVSVLKNINPDNHPHFLENVSVIWFCVYLFSVASAEHNYQLTPVSCILFLPMPAYYGVSAVCVWLAPHNRWCRGMSREQLVLINLCILWCHSCQSGAVAGDEPGRKKAGQGCKQGDEHCEEIVRVIEVDKWTALRREESRRSERRFGNKW